MIKTIKYLSKFKREYKKLKKKHYPTNKVAKAVRAIYTQNNSELIRFDNHYLHGDLQGLQELHISNNILLLYEIDDSTLFLARIGSHDDLFK